MSHNLHGMSSRVSLVTQLALYVVTSVACHTGFHELLGTTCTVSVTSVEGPVTFVDDHCV